MLKKSFRKIISLILMLAIAITNLMSTSVAANEVATKMYYLDNLEIEYSIISSWDDNQNISITLKNTGTINIEDWKLYYDINGEIYAIWNAEVEVDNDNNLYIKCTDYNSIIAPDSSVTFGYLMSDVKGIPDKISTSPDKDTNDNNDSEEYPEIEPIIYSKEITSEDEIAYDNDEDSYFRNQIILMASKDVTFDEINKLADNMSAKIVGYIEPTNEYQLEFTYDVDFDTIEEIIADLGNDPYISNASINYIINLSESYFPNDPESNIYSDEKLCTWNLYAINAFKAWDFLDEMETVRLGIIDGDFSEHDDVPFKKIFSSITKHDTVHGTRVAGIMAAKFDNGLGISGVCPNSEIYAYAMENKTSTFSYKIALTKLILKRVKVINVSMTSLDFDNQSDKNKRDKINSGNEKEMKKFKKRADDISVTLQDLIFQGYDFVVVVAAGNNGDIGYDAMYENYLSAIETPSVKNHIIVVGGLDFEESNNVDKNLPENYNGEITPTFYSISNIGERVDVIAPSKFIKSTYPKGFFSGSASIYKYAEEGTSFAAPHVSGIAGMMYAVNPTLKGNNVKAIITATSKLRTIPDSYENEYGIADAGLAVSTAYYYRDDSTEKIIFGELEDANDEEKIYSDLELTASYQYNGSTQTQTIKSDVNGKYEIVIPKEVDLSTLEIQINGCTTETDCLAEFLSSSAVVTTTVYPQSTITGRVTERNTTTQKITPIADYTVNILQNGKVIASGITDSDGYYKIVIDAYGDIIVSFNGDKQRYIYAEGKEYEADMEYLTQNNDDDDDDDDDENSDNKDDGDNNNDNGTDENHQGKPGKIMRYYKYFGVDIYYLGEYYECSSINTYPMGDHYSFSAYQYHYVTYNNKGGIEEDVICPGIISTEVETPIGDLPPYTYANHGWSYWIIAYDE